MTLVLVSLPARSVSATYVDRLSGAGVESMTFGWGGGSLPDGWSSAVLANQESEDCLIPMGLTSENVAADFGISRETQDKFSAESYQKAAAAQKAGKFKDEIVPLKVKVIDPKTEKPIEVVVDADDGIRSGVTAESLSKLKPSFKKDGSTHAGKLSLNDVFGRGSIKTLQGMPHRFLTALLRSSSLADRLLNGLASPSLASTLLPWRLAFHLGSWVWDLPTPFPKFWKRRAFLRMTWIFTRSMKPLHLKPFTVLTRLEFHSAK